MEEMGKSSQVRWRKKVLRGQCIQKGMQNHGKEDYRTLNIFF